jgi:hypothetical protein
MRSGGAGITVLGMDERIADEQRSASADDETKIYRDLRRRNERRADLARVLIAKRRQRVERLMAEGRKRKSDQAG